MAAPALPRPGPSPGPAHALHRSAERRIPPRIDWPERVPRRIAKIDSIAHIRGPAKHLDERPQRRRRRERPIDLRAPRFRLKHQNHVLRALPRQRQHEGSDLRVQPFEVIDPSRENRHLRMLVAARVRGDIERKIPKIPRPTTKPVTNPSDAIVLTGPTAQHEPRNHAHAPRSAVDSSSAAAAAASGEPVRIT
jgi:hypothetical protein